MSRADEIAQGLRDEHGGLIGGLVVEEYNQGHIDFEEGTAPPAFTTTSYDLGRQRAARLAAEQRAVKDWMRREDDRRERAMAEILADHPEALAEYRAKIAEIRGCSPSPSAPAE